MVATFFSGGKHNTRSETRGHLAWRLRHHCHSWDSKSILQFAFLWSKHNHQGISNIIIFILYFILFFNNYLYYTSIRITLRGNGTLAVDDWTSDIIGSLRENISISRNQNFFLSRLRMSTVHNLLYEKCLGINCSVLHSYNKVYAI